MATTNTRRWGTIQEAAEEKKVSLSTARRWISSGLIYAERVGPRMIRVDLNTLETLGRPLQYIPGGEYRGK